MLTFHILVFIALCIFGVSPMLRRPARIYEFPSLATVTFLGFAGPQIASLTLHPGEATTSAIENAILMTNLCFATAIIAYRGPMINTLYRPLMIQINDNRLFLVGVVFLFIGMVFGRLAGVELRRQNSSLATGTATIYLFIAGVSLPATAILLRNAIRRRTLTAWFFALLSSADPVMTVVFAGRRETAVHFLATIGLVLYFEKKVSPPRAAIACLIVAAMLLIPATGHYRSAIASGETSKLLEIDLIENFRSFLNEDSILELRNAAMIINNTQETGAYTFGANYWDELVWRFIPAQIVGRELKDSLMIARFAAPSRTLGPTLYEVPPGSTITAMGDAYTAFGFLGCLFFVLPARILWTLWHTAQASRDSVLAQLLYIGSITSAMRAITHQSADFLPGLIYQAIFLSVVWAFARMPK